MRNQITKAAIAIALLFAMRQGAVAETAAASHSTREIAALVGKATVTIKVATADGATRSGSGFLVDPTGTVVTNVHVVEGAQHIEIRLSNGDIYEPAGVRSVDRRRDIAILQLAAYNLPTVQLADSDSVAPGDHVVVLGTPLGLLENTVTSGVVSGIRDLDGTRLFQMDAAVSPGNSGGPVVNERGEVIGITVSKITGGQSLNFAIPIDYARGAVGLPTQAGLILLASASQQTSLFGKSEPSVPRKWKSLTSGRDNNFSARF